MRMVTVQRMPYTVDYAGKRYGPSEAPTSIPEALANGLGLKPVEEGDAQVAAASPAEAQDNLHTLLALLAPEAQEDEQPDDVLRRLVRERDALKQQVADLTDRSGREAVSNREQNVRLGELSRQREELGQQVEALTKELDEARARPALPPDARERLVALPKIGEKYADDILKALTEGA